MHPELCGQNPSMVQKLFLCDVRKTCMKEKSVRENEIISRMISGGERGISENATFKCERGNCLAGCFGEADFDYYVSPSAVCWRPVYERERTTKRKAAKETHAERSRSVLRRMCSVDARGVSCVEGQQDEG